MPQIYFGITTDGSASVLFGSPQYSFGFEQTQRNVVLNQQTGGTITAEPMSGYDNDVVTLSNTAVAGYNFDTYNITGATLTGNQFMFNGYDVEVTPTFNRQVYTLTLQNDGHGTISATKTTGYSGDTVTLSNTYKTYYRFNNYTQTGGSINGSTFTFGSQNATAKANFKVNAFTATGTFEKGSNVSVTANESQNKSSNVVKYAVHGAHTGAIPTAWYSTSNRWKPNNASAYKITLNGKLNLTGKGTGYNAGGGMIRGYAKATGCMFVNTTVSNSQSWSCGGNPTTTESFNGSYNKTLTSTTQNVNYGVSARLNAQGFKVNSHNMLATATYVANGTNGSWTATGYAP